MKNSSQIIFAVILILLSIVLITCISEKNNRQPVQYSESPDILKDEIVQIDSNGEINPIFDDPNIVESQESGLPPKINLIHYSKFASSFDPRYARIWGWSANGRVAYSLEGAINSEASFQIDFIILDLLTNNILFSKIIFSEYSESIDDWVDGIDLFYLHETSIQNALRTYEIIDERTNFLPFPLSRNNISYYARIDDFIYGEDEIWSLGETIIRYSLLVTANNESKVINTFKPFRWLTDADVCGYFISPCGNIILVIIAEDLGLYQHGGLLYRFVNLQL